MTGSGPLSLSIDELLAIHRDQLALFGGAAGLRDEGTLEGARGNAVSTFHCLEGGDLYDVAAAYAFSISEGQPFLDGNKRVGLNAALQFLAMNAQPLPAPAGLYEAMIGWRRES